jgi:hypothetical protein
MKKKHALRPQAWLVTAGGWAVIWLVATVGTWIGQ